MNWQTQLKSAITEVDVLLHALQLKGNDLPYPILKKDSFKLRVPWAFVRRMHAGDPHDPLLLQVLIRADEALETAGYIHDPLAEQEANPLPGLLHKYGSRVLLTVTSACAIHCRYCFRRHFPYSDNNPGQAGWQSVFAYLDAHPEVDEVILSGGDPLTVPDRVLASLLEGLGQRPTLKTLRIHSRLPIVLPDRITNELCQLLKTQPLQVIMVIHCNHAQELDEEVGQALTKLREAGVLLLNQAVLLKGINNSVDSLANLGKSLIRHQVFPYYLHLPDKVAGTAHFDVSEEEAKALYRDLLATCSGYAVPKLVRETPGKKNKTLVWG